MHSDETEGKDRPEADSGDREPDERRATDDLAEGLELMLRAARKAVRNVDTARLEDIGRRARNSLKNINPKQVEEMGRKAAEKLDPRRIEEIANDAGRELINVVERVADRVDRAVGGPGVRRPRSDDNDEGAGAGGDEGGKSDDAKDSGDQGSDDAKDSDGKPSRVRVED